MSSQEIFLTLKRRNGHSRRWWYLLRLLLRNSKLLLIRVRKIDTHAVQRRAARLEKNLHVEAARLNAVVASARAVVLAA